MLSADSYRLKKKLKTDVCTRQNKNLLCVSSQKEIKLKYAIITAI